ncbi:MAG: hypothetical protein IRY93_03655 [Chthoniobacterales bacterium]|nr:hypothetical protein [Chthoniobacterales bacterium]
MKRSLSETEGFSLIELTFAIGLTAFCLLTLFAMLPLALKIQQASIQQSTASAICSHIAADLSAALRLPPGVRSKQFNLRARWTESETADVLYFAKDGTFLPGSTNAREVPADAVFRATVTYLRPSTETTSLADISITWPAKVDPAAGGVPSGKVGTFAAINR